MTKKTGYKTISAALATGLMLASISALSCKSPLFGLGAIVDNAVPSISIAELEEGGAVRALINGDYVRGLITLRGGVSDDIGIASKPPVK
jgi:hypothetical protein